MSHHLHQLGLFDLEHVVRPLAAPQPATEKQINFAKALAAKNGAKLPVELMRDRSELSVWIERAKCAAMKSQFTNYPSAKQVQFAERIARLKRRKIPTQCFKDKTMMSRWIDGHRPR